MGDGIHLDDLRRPRFAPEIEGLLVGAADLGSTVELTVDALYETAAAQCGLDDFDDARLFREPFEVLCGALDGEAALAPRGRAAAHTQLVQFLVQRLRYVDLLKRHPEIRDQPMPRPIVIAGLPRTGTTHLHNLLAADPRLRHLPWWEAVEPFPAAGEPDSARIDRSRAALELQHRVVPHLVRMHEMTWDHAHEEIHLLALTGSSMYFETMATMPTWREWFTGTDQAPYYEELRVVLAALDWRMPVADRPERWVLKSPQHLEQLPAVMAALPDATVVVTHRDPVAVTGSMATMLAYLGRLNHDPVPVERIARYWADRLEEMLRACVRDREVVAPSQSLDVRFHEFMADQDGTVRDVYAVAGQPLDDTSRMAIDSYRRDHPRGRHGRVDHRLDDLGLDADERRRALDFYVERFGVAAEQLS